MFSSTPRQPRMDVSTFDRATWQRCEILDEHTVIHLDRTGSGNETAAHLLADGRLTLVFCAFEGRPLILRLYGRGRVVARQSAEYSDLLGAYYGDIEVTWSHQIVRLDFDLVQTSCGMNVPFYGYLGERDQLTRWAEVKGDGALEQYRREKNSVSIDGLPTGMFETVDS